MGSTEVPKYVGPNYNMDYTVGSNIEGGNDLVSMAKRLMESKGLPDFIRRRREEQGLGAIAGARKSGLKDLKGSVGNGAALTEGMAGINRNLTEGTSNLYNSLMEADYGAMKSDRQEGFGNLSNLIQMASGIASNKNQLRGDASSRMNDYNMKSYEIEEANRFKVGDLFSGLVSAGGQVGSTMAGRPGGCCFIFMEAYNGRLPWWVRSCRDEFAPESSARRQGYIRMSKWLVPLMNGTHPVFDYVESTPLKRGIKAVIRTTVNVIMIKPLTIWGGWYRNVKGYRRGWMLKPVVNVWFRIWEWFGGDDLSALPAQQGFSLPEAVRNV